MKQFVIGASILLAGALVGCSNSNNAPVNPAPEQTTKQQASVENTGDKKMLTEEEAINIVNKEIPGGKGDCDDTTAF